MKSSNPLKVSVTQLADFACRQGDLMPSAVVGPSAREGMRAHKILQDQRKQVVDHADWIHSELRVSCQCVVEGMNIRLGGRIDLVDTRAPLLTEIKTTLVPADQVPEMQRALQWAQLYLYGHVYLQQLSSSEGFTGLAGKLELELVHVNIRADTQSSETRTCTSDELAEHADAALKCYARWLADTQLWRQRMAASASKLPFPFDNFRSGQREMAAAIYRASRDKLELMCEAPTGIGKTISSLFPAIKSMGEGKIRQVVYLTAKVAGRLSAEQAMRKLACCGLEATMIQIRAKQPTCFCSNGRCERDASGRCPMTLGFFDRLPQARTELLAQGVVDNEVLDEIAWAHQLCPFELVLQLLPWMQVIVADYNYVFDPLVKISHFSMPRKDTLLLVDEAHNLLDRSRSMYSAHIDRSQCMQAATESRQSHPLLARELDSLSRLLLSVASDNVEDTQVSINAPTTLVRSALNVLEQMSAVMAQQSVLGEITSELWRALCRYAAISELYSDDHRFLVLCSRDGRIRQVRVILYCLDASRALTSTYRLFRSVVLFSATLRPGTFYRDTLGFDETTKYLQLDSPFPPEHCYRAVVDWIDTRYHHRQASMSKLVDLIHQSTGHKSGNYLVFFPSYAYLEQVHTLFCTTYPERTTWVQSRGQGRYEQQRLLNELDTVGHRVGFAIQGGVFGEGIDYSGERLIGTLVVGTGLPAMDQQTELIAQHYRESGRDGYDFAYRYPGFTRVLQTAGRVIRHESDTGFVLLVDSRFRQSAYKQLFPADWKVVFPADQATLIEALRNFWERSVPALVDSP